MFSRFLLTTICLACIPTPALAESGWFIDAGLGVARYDANLSNQQGTVELLFDPKDRAEQYAIGGGYRFDNDWSVAVEYGYLDSRDIDMDNYQLSLNRHWSIAPDWELYLGAISVYSEMKWQRDPINTVNREPTSEDSGWGAQLGVSNQITEKLGLHLRYQYLDLNHRTFLQPPTGVATFNHQSPETLTISLRVSL